MGPESIRALVEAAVSVRPIGVQLYTLDREAPSPSLRPASMLELEAVRDLLSARGVRAEVFQSVRRPQN